jgi:hypothetical protein
MNEHEVQVIADLRGRRGPKKAYTPQWVCAVLKYGHSPSFPGGARLYQVSFGTILGLFWHYTRSLLALVHTPCAPLRTTW